jgi:surfactin synthase thioesterase subunit
MPELAVQFDVISVDLRGVAGSTAREGGFDAQNLAEDLYQLLLSLQLKDAYVVGHDLGGMVAYALVQCVTQIGVYPTRVQRTRKENRGVPQGRAESSPGR